jgi:hypothetical protein
VQVGAFPKILVALLLHFGTASVLFYSIAITNAPNAANDVTALPAVLFRAFRNECSESLQQCRGAFIPAADCSAAIAEQSG